MRRRGVALAGFMGVGKSTVGPLVARGLGLPFVDLDEVIVRQQGCSIERIFAEGGEPTFRRIERSALEDVLSAESVVLALGGGTLHQPGVPERLAAAGYAVVSLVAEWPTLAARLGGSGRPLAADAERLFATREAGYLAADRVVAVDGRAPDEVAALVVADMGNGS